MLSVQEMRERVNTYLALVGGDGTAVQIADLYADDATLEDPVGTPPKRGRAEIVAFYEIIEPVQCSTELLSFAAGGDTAVFAFRIVTVFGEPHGDARTDRHHDLRRGGPDHVHAGGLVGRRPGDDFLGLIHLLPRMRHRSPGRLACAGGYRMVTSGQ